MDHLVSVISRVMEKGDSRRIIIGCAAAFLFLLVVIESVRGSDTSLSSGAFIFAVLGSLLGGINLSIAYSYFSRRIKTDSPGGWFAELKFSRSFMDNEGFVFSVTLFSIFLGFLGFSAMFSRFDDGGQEIGYVGLVILLIATYALSSKIAAANV